MASPRGTQPTAIRSRKEQHASPSHCKGTLVTTTAGLCAFCRIIHGDVQDYRVFEDEVSLAFLDHRPLFSGHCLLVPREHNKTMIDLPAALIAPLFINAKL